jgi:geranylgeranyl pyrophosphate synthase
MIFELRDVSNLEKRLYDLINYADRKIIEFADQYNLYSPSLEPRELYAYAKERIYSGGKRFRPALAFASTKALGGDMEKTTPFAYAIEVKHSGYLDIDDVIDESRKRRGKPSTWVRIGKKKAIIVGLLNSNVMPYFCIYIASKKPYEWPPETQRSISKILFNLDRETVEGEYQDVDYKEKKEMIRKLDVEKQELIYRRKTGAYTVGGPIAGGAIIGGMDEKIADNIYTFCSDLFGSAFQIMDDVLDLDKTAKKFGKEFADDLNEGKPTLIVAMFNEKASESAKRKFYELFGRMNPPLTMEEREYLISLIEKYGIIEDCREYAEKKMREGLAKLSEIIPQNERSKELYGLLVYSVKRKR